MSFLRVYLRVWRSFHYTASSRKERRGDFRVKRKLKKRP